MAEVLLSRAQIEALIPHRDPFLLLDRVVLEDRVAQLEYALMFIRQHASRKNIWYAAVADAALQGDVVKRGRK